MIKKLTLSILFLLLILVANFGPLFAQKVQAADYSTLFSGSTIVNTNTTETTTDFQVKLTTSSTGNYDFVANDGVSADGSNFLVITTNSTGNYSDVRKIGTTLSLTATQNNITTAILGLTAGGQYTASLLYRSDSAGENGAGAINVPGISSGSIKDFYQISSVTFTASTNVIDPNTIQAGDNSNNASSQTSTLPICTSGGLANFEIHIAGCFAQITYYVFFVPTSFVFALTGQLLDWAMDYTLDSNSYSGGGAAFVEKGWKITRDIANIFFIFILLYTAIGMILELHSVNAKKTIAMVIVVALLLNFSLFFTKIIIDASNILGGIFYNNISSSQTDTTDNSWAVNKAIGGKKNISVAIVSKFNPQKIFNETTDLKVHTSSGADPIGNLNAPEAGGPPAGQFIIISLIMTIINCVGIWVFFVVAFLFIGRVVGLWILMVFAPISFVSYTLPDGAGKVLGDMHHTKWWDTLFKQAFVVPIFMFFMYLILAFLNTNFYKDATAAATTTESLLAVIIPLILITILLIKAKGIATDMSGEIGKQMSSFATTIGGAAVGLTAGGAAILARGSVGRLANRVSNDQELRDKAATGDKFAQAKLSVASTLSKNTFDIRNTSAANLASKQSGMNFNKGLATVGLDTKSLAGGWQGKEARKDAKNRAYAKELGYDHHAYENEEEKINAEKAKLQTMKDESGRLKDALNTAKTINPSSAESKTLAEQLANTNANIRAMENGGVIKEYEPSRVETVKKKIKRPGLNNEYDEVEEQVVIPGKVKSSQTYTGINTMEKNKERIKTAREKEFYASKRRESGKVFEQDERDDNLNIKKFGKEITKDQVAEREAKLTKTQTTQSGLNTQLIDVKAKISRNEDLDTNKQKEAALENDIAKLTDDIQKQQNYLTKAKAPLNEQGFIQLGKEFEKGFLKGVAPGAIVGSFIPGGTIVGALGGGFLAGLKEAFINYSGTTNVNMASGHAPNTKYESSYKEPSGGGHTEAAHEEHHEEAHGTDAGHGGH